MRFLCNQRGGVLVQREYHNGAAMDGYRMIGGCLEKLYYPHINLSFLYTIMVYQEPGLITLYGLSSRRVS